LEGSFDTSAQEKGIMVHHKKKAFSGFKEGGHREVSFTIESLQTTVALRRLRRQPLNCSSAGDKKTSLHNLQINRVTAGLTSSTQFP
jgi:hypothetical protein